MVAAAALLSQVFSLSMITADNAKRGIVSWKLGTIFLIPAAIMAIIGAYIGSRAPTKVFLLAFEVLLTYILIDLIRVKPKEKVGKLAGNVKGYLLGILAGAIAGFFGGLLGIGSGSIIVAALTFVETDYKKIPATAAYITLLSYASGFITYLLFLRNINYVLWLVIFTGGVLGGFAGYYLANKVKPTIAKYIIIAIIIFILIRIMLY
jgi:uncharacterized membrane protein YfcA